MFWFSSLHTHARTVHPSPTEVHQAKDFALTNEMWAQSPLSRRLKSWCGVYHVPFLPVTHWSRCRAGSLDPWIIKMVGDPCPHTPIPKYEQEGNFCCTSVDTPAQLSGPDTHRNKKKYLEKYIPNCNLDVTLRKRDRMGDRKDRERVAGELFGVSLYILGNYINFHKHIYCF